MAHVIPLDEFITDEWYPGFKPAFDHAPFYVEPFRTFNREDESRFWFLDFHWPRGLTPLGLIWNEDGYAWGTQFAAENLPLPPGRGIGVRMAGIHTYASPVDVTSPVQIGERAQRMGPRLGHFLENFDDIWAERRDEVERGWQHFVAQDTSAMSLPELAAMLADARAFHKRAFEIHFEVMYPMLVNYLGFYGLCGDLGVDQSQIGKFLQGYDTKIMETDRELGRLAKSARSAGLEQVFATTEDAQLGASLDALGGAGSAWMTQFRDFLAVYGYRTEGSCDVALPSWIEEPTPALAMIKSFLLRPDEHDYEKARAEAIDEREAAIDDARSQLTREEQEAFDAGLASCQRVNFPWWQDDHNYYIDLRVSLPLRWAARAIAERVGGEPDDGLFLFWPELTAVAAGEKDYALLKGIVEDRKQYFQHWHEKRSSMPKVLGTVPEAVTDPILIEIFGLNDHFLNGIKALGSGEEIRTLTGLPASKGKARGIARVLNDADELARVNPGEILVCESTSPNWTPAFAKIAACVCDGGGMLSHAAIVGREYRVPTVTAVGLATVAIKDGDEIEVDGDAGTVTIFTSATDRV